VNVELSLAEMPGEIQADERLLQHIFTNLLTNAVKYSYAGRAVWFEIGRVEAEMICTIRDQGIRIPEADREWLFNAFQRARPAADMKKIQMVIGCCENAPSAAGLSSSYEKRTW
jgi:signal transduction histidine kinase